LFLLFWIRACIQDILFRPSDYIDQKKTLAIKYGSKIAAKITACLLFVTTLIILAYTLVYLTHLNSLFLYVLFFLIAPLCYCGAELWNARTRTKIQFINTIINLIIWLTILALPLLTYNLYNYALN